MKLRMFILFYLVASQIHAQELFTWSEPASNMPAKAIGFRVTNNVMKETATGNYVYRVLPEIMWGVSGKLMVHAEGFFSNLTNGFGADGAALYFKERVLSQDEVHRHFRMAIYARVAFNDNHIHEPAINLTGNNSGYEAGLIATRLINKTAISAGASLMHATNNTGGFKFYYDDNDRNALAGNLSLGKLILPRNYTNYRQTNVNLMLELLGQTNLGSGKTYIDIAPVVQLIIISRMRVDASYKFAVLKDLYRSTHDAFLLRLEYNIFNAYK